MSATNGFKKESIDAILALGTPKAMVLNSTHSTDIDTQVFIDDVSANEVSGAGYTAGGLALTSVTTTIDTANDWVPVDCADLSWTTVTISNARYVCFYVDTGTPGTSTIINIIDLGSTESRTAQDFDLTINANGFARIA